MSKVSLIPKCVEAIKRAGAKGLTPRQIEEAVGARIEALPKHLSRWAHEHRDIQCALSGLWYAYKPEGTPVEQHTFKPLAGYNLEQQAHREGSLDYRKWPSRVGGEAVPYQTPRSAA